MSRPAPAVRRSGADLHVHTTHSDGACSPGEVVQAAANLGLAALAITDHDTLTALAVARPWAEAIALIRGAGGVAALAHPPHNLRLDDLGRLVDGGLGAIEVAGPGIQGGRGRRWRDWASTLALTPVAGSDFHAADRPGRWL